MWKDLYKVTDDKNYIGEWKTTLMFYPAYFAWFEIFTPVSYFCNYVNFETQNTRLEKIFHCF